MIEIVKGDSADVLKTIKTETIDLTITSPPYDDIRDYNGYTFDFDTISRELFRVTKSGGVVVWIVADQTKNGSETGTSFRQALHFMEVGFLLHDTMIWAKDGFSFPESNRYPQTFEYMFIFSKGKPKTFNGIKDRKNRHITDGRRSLTQRQEDGATVKKRKTIRSGDYGIRFNVWKINAEKRNDIKHPAPFPEALVKDHLRTWSAEGDVVLDPFLGSGTTAVACYEMKRDCIGIEISEEYVELAKKRIDEVTAQLRMDL